MEVLTVKIISMVLLGGISLILGLLPLLFKRCIGGQDTGGFSSEKRRSRSRWDTFISCLSCFGGGVILATCLTHMLPEVNEMVQNNIVSGSMPDTGGYRHR